MATLHKQLQETGQKALRLQQAMQPQTPADGIRDLRQGDRRCDHRRQRSYSRHM